MVACVDMSMHMFGFVTDDSGEGGMKISFTFPVLRCNCTSFVPLHALGVPNQRAAQMMSTNRHSLRSRQHPPTAARKGTALSLPDDPLEKPNYEPENTL